MLHWGPDRSRMKKKMKRSDLEMNRKVIKEEGDSPSESNKEGSERVRKGSERKCVSRKEMTKERGSKL